MLNMIKDAIRKQTALQESADLIIGDTLPRGAFDESIVLSDEFNDFDYDALTEAEDEPEIDTSDVETEDTDGTYHLLWASDRLEIARSIEARLARIYTDLVMVEKFLHYKHSYKAWIKDLLPKLNADRDRKMSIAEQCRRRWMRLGGSQNAIYQEDEEE